ncbi:MAG: hypothetical protein VKK42_19580 [Lyngbya sp.]|nr:hypothetical protein [Lyngbya sp.]
MSNLILPGHPDFAPTLVQAPFFWKELQRDKSDYFVYAPDVDSGVLKPLTPKEAEDYLLGGEADYLVDQQEELDAIEAELEAYMAEFNAIKNR